LFYVAITRAEENVMLTYASNRFRNGQSWICSPSRFLDDIDPEYLQGGITSPPAPPHRGGESFSFDSSTSFSSHKGRESRYSVPPVSFSPQKVSVNSPPIPPSLSPPLWGGAGGEVIPIGSTIRHDRFGLGKVVELTGENENAKATVDFESFGRKQLLLKFAKYEIVK